MPEFSFTFASEDAPNDVVAVEFQDQRVLLPDWVLETIAFFEMEHDQQEEFFKGCRKVKYAAFLARCRQEAVLFEKQETRDVLNRIQQSYIGTWFARRRMFRPIRAPRSPRW